MYLMKKFETHKLLSILVSNISSKESRGRDSYIHQGIWLYKTILVTHLTKEEVLSLSEFTATLVTWQHNSLFVSLSHLWLLSLILFILILPFVFRWASLFFVLMPSFSYHLSGGREMIFQGNTLRGCIIHLKSLEVKSTLRVKLNDLLKKNLSQYRTPLR